MPRVASESSETISLVTNIPSRDLLVTAKIHVYNSIGKVRTCRVLLDTCSNTNFITERLATLLNLSKTKFSIPIAAMNKTRTVTNNLVTARIRSRIYNFERTLNFLTIDDIAGLVPDERILRNSISLPRNIQLADPEFDEPAEVDMLIGSGTTLSTFCVGQINLSTAGGLDLYLQKTRLGWIIGGAFPTDGLSPYNRQCHAITMEDVMKRFWEIEEIATKRYNSPEEISCEDHFKRTVTRNNEGRYIVALPFNSKKDQLGESRLMATKRLIGLERKLERDPELKTKYNAVLQEYLTLGHMSEVKDNATTGGGFYLPHHAVIKDSSLTTKVRVVFDGSAKSSTGIALNDTLMVGPTIQDDIFSLLLRFRNYQYVLTGDIEKMYRQFEVRKEDRKYQRILWRGPSGSIKTYELNTVTFGLSPAPFLAIRCLHQLANDEMAKYPRAAQIIKRDLYVDDLLTGATTFDDALHLRNEITALLQRGGLNLRQWASNEPLLLKGLPSGSINLKLQSRQDQTIKTLGVHWNSERDIIIYTVSPIARNGRVTKRTVLSHIARIFDPLGLLGPVVTCAKIYSDNGTNFVGANNKLNEIVKHLRSETHNEKTFKFCVDNGIKWHFIPPQSPNFGGIWEAAVKSFKHHLRRVVGQQLLTFEQLYTLITEVEAILNSRPLTPISSDPNDPIVLSPGHYLIGNSLTSLPEVNYINTPYNRLSLWQHIQKIKQDFWARWHKEYLNELNIRHRWSQGSHSIREGSLVLIKEDNLPPLRWLMGRVIETRPGSDGVVRVVRIKTSKGVIERNVRKLAPLPLPIESDRDSEK